jgi:para-aminobenzoate synthetase component 1
VCEEDIDEDLDEINLQSEDHESKVVSVEIKQRISKKRIPKSLKMLYHISKEICMKLIFCMEFYAENAIIDPLDKFLKLNEISQPPFAVF